MTIASTVNRNNYVGTGITGPFAFNFRIDAVTDLVVTKRTNLTGAETVLAYGADWNLSSGTVVRSANGSITLTTALAVGETLSIRRAPPLTQPTSIRNQGTFLPAVHEDEFDRLVMQIQSIKDELDRKFGVSESYDPSTLDLTIKPGAPGQLLGINSIGDGLDWFGDAPSGQSYLALNAYNVLEYGATGDGVTDDRAALNTLVNVTVPGAGGDVVFPPGAYRIGSNLTIPSNVRVRILPGAQLNPDAGVVVTINGPVETGLYRLFGGAGTIRFGDRVSDVYDRWFNNDIAAAAAAAQSHKQRVHITQQSMATKQVITVDANIVFDCDVTVGVPGDFLIHAQGADGTTYALNDYYEAGAFQLTFASVTGLAAGDYLRLLFVSGSTVVYSHYIIESVDAGTKVVTLNRGLDTDIDGRKNLAITSITRAGAVATVTTTANHGLATGAVVKVAGATQAEYNGVFTITVTGAATFTYAVIGAPATPATGTILYSVILDTAGDVNFTKYAPVSVSIDGQGHRFLMTQDEPGFVLFDRCTHSELRNAILKCTGAASTANGAVRHLVKTIFSYDVVVDTVRCRNLQGGSEFGNIAGYYSSYFRVLHCNAQEMFGFVRGIEAFYSTHVLIQGCLVHGSDATVGLIFTDFCYHVDVIDNNVKDSRGAVFGAGIQIGANVKCNVVGNVVAEVMSTGHIYVNGMVGGVIANNRLTQARPGSSAYGIHLRTAFNVSVAGNTMYGELAGGIYCRQVTSSAISGNTISLLQSGSAGINVLWVVGDTTPCSEVVISGNLINIESTNAGGSHGINLAATNGHHHLTVRGNHIRVRNTSTTSNNTFGIEVSTSDADSIVTENTVDVRSGGVGTRYGMSVNNTNTNVFQNHLIGDSGCTYVSTCPNSRFNNAPEIMTKTSGTTAARPALAAQDAGFLYYDTTIAALIAWDGAGWDVTP